MGMIKRHSDYLATKLDKLKYGSYCYLDKAALRFYFGASRLSKEAWREIFALLPEGVEIDQLSVHEYQDDIVLVSERHTYPASTYI